MAARGAPDGPVTVLITDIEGSTDLQSRVGDVRARNVVRAHDAVIREALAEFGGHEVKTMGDGFIAWFASTRRALECAVAVQERVAERLDGVRVRMGLHAGEVIHEGDDIHGAAVSAAARIMAHADGGKIVVSDLVRQLAGAAGMTFRERGGVQLKGLEGTWVLHEVVWRDPADAAPAAVAAAPSLVGREAEVLVLRRAIDGALGGRGSIVLLAGEPGIGKTTLAVDATAYAHQRRCRVLWGSCWEGEGAPAFWPWIQVLRALAADLDDDGLAAAVGAGAAYVTRLIPDVAPRLADVHAAPDADGEHGRFLLFDAVTSTLCRAASRRPVVIVLDDLHWADESSLLLLGFVANQLASNPVAIVATYRDTEVDAGDAMARLLHDVARRGSVVPVGGLDAHAVGRLMATTAGAEVNAELTGAVHRQTGGNPLFVGEITRLLEANEALDRNEVSVGVPAGVREVIERRMARLPQRCIELLTLGAVVGEEFGLDVVAAAASSEVADVVEQLEAAVEGGAARPAGIGRYRFAHALFREALYEGQGPIARARLHLRVANALEARAGERGDVPAAELAYHFAEAALTGEGAKAVDYARLAGQQATRALAYTEAIAHYERAMSVLDLLGGAESERAELLLDVAAARWRCGDRPGATADIHRALDLARRTGRTDVFARAALALQRLGGTSGLADSERTGLLREAAAALGDEASALRARVLAGLAQESYHAWEDQQHIDESAALAAEAVAIARRVDDPETLTAALLALHDVQWLPGLEAERIAVAEDLFEAARRAGDRERATEAVLLQATALLELGDPRGVDRLEDFVTSARELHQPRFDYLAATRSATLAMITGDVSAIDRHLDEARRLADGLDEPDAAMVENTGMLSRDTLLRDRRHTVPYTRRAYAGRSALEMVNFVEVVAALDDGDVGRARSVWRGINLDDVEARSLKSYGWLLFLAMYAELACGIGDEQLMSEVERRLRPYADRCVITGGSVNFLGHASEYLGMIYAATGRADDAKAAFTAALGAYERLGADGWAVRARAARDAIHGRSSEHAGELRRGGGWWEIRYDGRAARVKDVKGMRDLAVLLASPGKEVAAADLMATGLVAESGADVVLDERARADFRRRLDELDADIADAESAGDAAGAEKGRSEREALAHELAAAVGLGGRARTLGDPAERARKAVSARIRDAIERVQAEDAALGTHLHAAVRTGTWCVYAPDPPVTWRVTDDTPR